MAYDPNDPSGNLSDPVYQANLKGLVATGARPDLAPQLASLANTPIVVQPNQTIGATNLTIPSVDNDLSGANSVVAGGMQTATNMQTALAAQTPPPGSTPVADQNQGLIDSLSSLYGQDIGKAQATATGEANAGIPQMQKELQQISGDIGIKNAEYNALSNTIEGKPITMNSIIGSQAQVKRMQASEIGLLSARAQALQGNITLATQTVAKAVALQFAGIEDQISVKERTLKLIQPLLNAEQNKIANAQQMVLDEQKIQVAAQKEAQKQIQTMAIEAAAGGAPADLVRKIQTATDPVAAAAAYSEFNQQQQNLKAIQEAGVGTRYAIRNGEVQDAKTGYAFHTPEEFFATAGVSSFDEATAKGLFTQINASAGLDQESVLQLRMKYPDAGISSTDSFDQASAKLQGSRIYKEQVRPPAGAAGSGGGGGVLGLTNQQIDNISPLVTQFQSSPIVQKYNVIGEAYSFVQSLSNNTTNPSDDQALVYAFAKAQDPDSVVREGEYATVQKYAQSMTQAYGKSVTQAIAGTGFLSTDARKNMKATIASRFQTVEKSYQNLYSETERRVNLIGNTDKGGQLLNNYGGAFAQPSSPPVNTVTAPTTSETGMADPAKNWWQKATNWMFNTLK